MGPAPLEARIEQYRLSQRACLADLRQGRGLGIANPYSVPFLMLCNLRSPKLWLGRHDRPHGARRPGDRGARFAPALTPRVSSSFHPAAQDRGGGIGELGPGSRVEWVGRGEDNKYNQ